MLIILTSLTECGVTGMLTLLGPFKGLSTLLNLSTKPSEDNQASKPSAHEIGIPKTRQRQEKLQTLASKGFGVSSA